MIIGKKRINAEINSYIEKGKYTTAADLAQKNGFKELADKYYKIAINKLKEDAFLERLRKKESHSPSKKCHLDIIENVGYLLPEERNNNLTNSQNYMNYNDFLKNLSIN